MFKHPKDQAHGLRRMMATAKPRAYSVLSATSNNNQSRFLTNLSASINGFGSNVIVVHASNETHGTDYQVGSIPALLDVAMGNTLLLNAIKMSEQGFAVAKFTHDNTPLDAYASQQLGFIFEELTHEFDVVLVDANLNAQNMLPLPILNENEIVIELSRHPDSIKQAYSLIKRIYSQVGRRNFCIVVDEATEEQATRVFNNIAAVAWRYLKIRLSFFGAIPTDEHLKRAAMLGRSVVEAFPTAMSTSAFHKIAQKLDYSIDLDAHATPLKHATTT